MGLNEGNVQKLLDWTYEKVLNGAPGSDTVYELSNSYLTKHPTKDKAIDSLIRWQQGKAGANGFAAGLGGIVVMPVAIPVNLASVIYMQMRMIAAIAHIRGYDLKDDQVQTFVYACLTGQSASEVVKQSGIKIASKIGEAQIKRIPGEAIKQINQKVGFRLITKFGEKGAVNLGKMVPFLGGVVGATFDASTTYAIGKAAKKTFIEGGYDNDDRIIIDI
ncbi:EcsC family protein [Lysinibacillus sp. CNPSo 3705]|uniref:EcsC family protein n=1 Tax=Lysinibacillus sp. CNPSo 3705 TaxID=3028148 RepID=UPI0023644CA0|nr:EcsC family protein [Lysinibacillus sp. CNPSo 3705]MDD1505399.1 EcsC family protein [Lysinibacillus sp. CNPSo 3705]